MKTFDDYGPATDHPHDPRNDPEDDYELDEMVCERCNGDGTDPLTDHLLPCPDCQGEQKP